MCGITGVIGLKNEAENESVIRAMTECIVHRGPDQDGFFVDDAVGLGMRRLSIIDVSTGKQPISTKDDSALIFFNGEIYNYKELREGLVRKGYEFKTHSDTEVILHAYEEYKEGVLGMLRGMFTFCIYDKKEQRLFLARDLFGIKPLYYFAVDKKLKSYGSEIKSILLHPEYKKEINHDAVFNYLRFQYNPLTETFFKNIFSLPPAHYISVDARTGEYTINKYSHIDFAPDTTRKEETTKAEIVETLTDSVAHHMISDVPVGSFLSGGVDSSIIAVLMQDLISKEKPGVKNKTFTVGFDLLSEGKEARTTSDFLGTDHTEIIIGPDEYFSVLPKLVWHFDEPVADPSAIALYFVAREARKKVTVVLSGEGADELFGGYRIYRAPLAYKRFAWIPHALIKPFLAVPFEYWGKQFLYRASHKLQDWYIGNASIFKPEEIKNLWKKDDTRRVFTLDHLYAHATGSDSQKMQYIDIHTWLVGDILAKADKMTMANSLELRVPFLDKEVLSLARTLPDVLKWNKGTTKYVLREAFKNIIPEATRHRPKLGFPTPLRAWLTKDRVDVYDAIRTCAYIQEHMNIQEVESIIEKHIQGIKDNSRKIYILYMLALWYQVFFDKQ